SVYIASPASTVQVPFSQPRDPATRPMSRGHSAKSAAAARPIERRPVARRPTYAVATTVTAFAASATGRPTPNAIPRPRGGRARGGTAGTPARGGQRNRAAPDGAIFAPTTGTASSPATAPATSPQCSATRPPRTPTATPASTASTASTSSAAPGFPSLPT